MTSGLGSRSLRAARQRLLRRLQTRNERGFTLVEILIALILLGGVVVGLMGTLYTANVVSDVQRQQALVDAEARRLEEKIRAHAYVKCALPSYMGLHDDGSGSGQQQKAGTNDNDYWPGDYQDAFDDGTNPIDPQVHFRITDIAWGYWDPATANFTSGNTSAAPTFKSWNPSTATTDDDNPLWTWGCDGTDINAAIQAGASGQTLPPGYGTGGGLASFDCGLQRITLQARSDDGNNVTYQFLKRNPAKSWPTC